MRGNIPTKLDMQELKKFTDSVQETEFCNCKLSLRYHDTPTQLNYLITL